MNDRYLYRAKRKIDKQWIYGNLIQTDDGVYIIQNYVPQHLIGNYEVDTSTICQCTGIKDKNGNLIFEHDILNLSMSGKVEVEFNDGVWGSDFGDGCILPMRNSLFGEGGVVIGNIFDNQELLEVGE